MYLEVSVGIGGEQQDELPLATRFHRVSCLRVNPSLLTLLSLRFYDYRVIVFPSRGEG